MVLIAFGAGMGAGWPIIWELDSGVIERLRVTPASRLALLLGTVLRDIVMFAVPGVVVIAVGAAFGYHVHWSGLVLLFVLLALLTAACSGTSTRCTTPRRRPARWPRGRWPAAPSALASSSWPRSPCWPCGGGRGPTSGRWRSDTQDVCRLFQLNY
jgi:hypothetical protein